MRVISGRLGGRNFDSPKGHRTHPMSDKVRGALFNALGDISSLSVLDTFAGSGALSFEAISRGANSVVAIDNDRRAHETLVKNIRQLDLEDTVSAIRAYVNAWSTRHQDQKFDIILADPPYDDLPFRDLKILPRHLAEHGVLALSWPGGVDAYYFPELIEVSVKNYGDAQLIFYRR